ncbi:hypothetical protein SLEP1_g33602 [Rubroshorea leprosula]|uniref:Small auxin up regulated protein n=1 Tax=Rubroshorea leprosula TaxID=152421 RepID=A0AAV5KHB2_9ROSI|nr:hypothetical protein SLEP1_g33602 [Rubroshorea leprosula]
MMSSKKLTKIAAKWKKIFSELLKRSEEQFGFPADGLITLPCESQVMEYIILLIACGVSKDLEKTLLASVASSNCSISSLAHQEWKTQQLLVCTC